MTLEVARATRKVREAQDMAAKQEVLRMHEEAQAPLPAAQDDARQVDSSPSLYGALARAQAKMPNALFNKVNPHFRNKYADLASLRAATLPHLSENGLCILQFTGFDANNNFVLFTRLAHESGEFVEGAYPLPVATDKPQVMGSALTYARRYGWGSIVGEASDDDDDANVAQTNGGQRQGASEVARGQEPLSKAKSRPIYDALIKEMRAITVQGDLTNWALENTPRIYSMHDEFQRWFRDEYQSHITTLKEGVTEEGSPLKQQLKASLEAEGTVDY